MLYIFFAVTNISCYCLGWSSFACHQHDIALWWGGTALSSSNMSLCVHIRSVTVLVFFICFKHYLLSHVANLPNSCTDNSTILNKLFCLMFNCLKHYLLFHVVNLPNSCTDISTIFNKLFCLMFNHLPTHLLQDISRCLLWVQRHHQAWPVNSTNPLVKAVDMMMLNKIKESYCQIRVSTFNL